MSTGAGTPTDVGGARQIVAELGPDVIRDLHRGSRGLDVAAFVVLWSGAFGLAVALGSYSFSVWWLGLLLLQGFLLQILGFFAHDALLHREAFGRRASWIAAALCFAPVTVEYTDYRNAHLVHHRYVNTDRDSEEYKRDFDRRWVKIALLTLLGTKLSWSGGFRRDDRPAWRPEFSPAESRRLTIEKWIVRCWLLGMLGLAFVFPRVVLLGYLLPLVVAAPVASSFRVILEHGDVDTTNPFGSSTYYRTGFISGPLFLYDSGDCHIVHHFFPAIPFYRMPRALRLIRPILDRAGVQQHRSMVRLLYLWFVSNKPHGQRWVSPSPR